ncbi:uncharacterized protein LOC106673954 [Cimex lectularius]|uniref:Uncharacterized protein n=1 Tax=Cimex lectularius TaxID=79782 RepID=A0A8I6SI51_CIMLE|nr:uncharacterized protein LOC106673954 [Cimex lectularius]
MQQEDHRVEAVAHLSNSKNMDMDSLYEMPFWYPECQAKPRHGLMGDIRDLAVTRLPPEATPTRSSSQQFANPLFHWTPKHPDFYKEFDVKSIPPPTYDFYNEVKRRDALSLNETVEENRKSTSTKSWGDRYSAVTEQRLTCGPNFNNSPGCDPLRKSVLDK